MEIKGKVHCLFEQSGTFKNQFKALGYEAYDYDIQNNFGETDYQIDLFAEIENAYAGKPSIWDNITPEDLVMAFFPCIYFTEKAMLMMSFNHYNYRNMDTMQTIDYILERNRKRNEFYELCIKMFAVALRGGVRLIMENPDAHPHYLRDNFLMKPALIDKDRTMRGDFFSKPTAYWYLNCEPTYGQSFQRPKETFTIEQSSPSRVSGMCSEERSMISPDYARNFICDFILGRPQKHTQLSLFQTTN